MQTRITKAQLEGASPQTSFAIYFHSPPRSAASAHNHKKIGQNHDKDDDLFDPLKRISNIIYWAFLAAAPPFLSFPLFAGAPAIQAGSSSSMGKKYSLTAKIKEARMGM